MDNELNTLTWVGGEVVQGNKEGEKKAGKRGDYHKFPMWTFFPTEKIRILL